MCVPRLHATQGVCIWLVLSYISITYRSIRHTIGVEKEGSQEVQESVQSLSCVRLCDSMDCSLPGSSAQGIFQARVLECGLNEELLILKYSLRKGKWRFYRGEPDPGWCFYPQWNVVFFERLWFGSVHETFIDHYLGKLVYLQGTELSLVGNTKN